MIYLNLFQSNTIIDNLKLHAIKLDHESLCELIQEKAAVSRQIVELYIRAWNHNHPEGWTEPLKHFVSVVNPDDVGTHTVRTVEQRVGITSTKQPTAPREGSIIQQIIALHVAGKSNKEIIALGYNKSTVGRQVSEYKKK